MNFLKYKKEQRIVIFQGVMQDSELGGNSKFRGGIQKLTAVSIPFFLKRGTAAFPPPPRAVEF